MTDSGLTPEQRAWFQSLSLEERTRFIDHQVMAGTLFEFLSFLENDDLTSGWPLLHPSLRRQLVKPWLDGNLITLTMSGYDYDETLAELTNERPEHDLWSTFQEVQTSYIAALPPEDYGVGSNTRLVAPDIELLYLFDRTQLPRSDHGDAVLPSGQSAPAFAVLMLRVDAEWKILTFGTEEIPDI